ncbi:hypothetical protein [Sulfurimonas sp.]|uniref:hypothetical protein n=1 Tax=Sulfurimonas sp. TaxID=2022749 RepID=UPI003569E312
MKNLIIFLILMILFNGCSHTSPYRQIKPNEIIQNKYVLVEASDRLFEINKKYDTVPKLKTGLPRFHKSIKGSQYTINIQTYPYKYMQMKDSYLNKDAKYLDSDTYVETYDENDKEQNIKYRRHWIAYINNMKCSGQVFSRNHGGTLYSATTKNYSIACGYYDKTEKEYNGQRLLMISYIYNYANDKSRLQKDTNLKREELLTKQQAEDGLKQAVKELVKTIKIKNFDKERMEKEGLMHYDKEFKSSKW